jgi:tetratricopeptide (TPR) repeat protein
VQDDYYVASRDKGVALDLRVSIALANLLVDRAGDSDETGAALNNLGIALATLGERDSGTERLEQAVEAFQQALKEYTRDRVPLDWAATQKNLGTALQTLGARDSDTDRLEQAVEAYQQTLKEYTRDEVPLNWAATQNNLGDALKTLGARDSDADRLEQAVAAFQQALKERTRDRVPLDWAMTRYNWAITELTLFEKTAQAAHLDRAQDLLRTAAAEFAAAGASHYVDMAAGLQAKIDAARAVRSRRLGAGRFKC